MTKLEILLILALGAVLFVVWLSIDKPSPPPPARPAPPPDPESKLSGDLFSHIATKKLWQVLLYFARIKFYESQGHASKQAAQLASSDVNVHTDHVNDNPQYLPAMAAVEARYKVLKEQGGEESAAFAQAWWEVTEMDVAQPWPRRD